MEIAWTVIGVIVPILVGLGGNMLGLTPPEFLIARICFWFSALLLGAMTLIWMVFSGPIVWWRLTIGGVIAIAIAVGLPFSLRWVKKRQTAVVTQSSSPDPFPRLGMRVSYLSDPVAYGRQDVEFRLRLLSGRPPSSLSIEPVYSKLGVYSIRFHPLSFLAGDQELPVEFEVWKFDTPPSRKSRVLRRGWGDLIAEFVRESLGNGWGIETSPVIVKFRDGDDYREQRFRFTFDTNTRQLSVIDEYPDIVMRNNP